MVGDFQKIIRVPVFNQATSGLRPSLGDLNSDLTVLAMAGVATAGPPADPLATSSRRRRHHVEVGQASIEMK